MGSAVTKMGGTMTIDFGSINFLAVIVAGFATFMIGGAWYTAFAKTWQKAQGYSEERAKEIQEQSSPLRIFGTMILCYLVISAVMAIITQAAGINTLAGSHALKNPPTH